MIKRKRLLTNEEFDKILNIRETKGDKQVIKFMDSLQDKLYEQVEEVKK